MKKIAVVNRTNLKNYGSVLQCYALSSAINKLGYQSVVVWEKGSISKNRDFRVKKLMITACKLLFHPSLLRKTISITRNIQKEVIDVKVEELFNNFVEQNIDTEFYSTAELEQIAKTPFYSKFVCGSDQVWCSTSLYVDPLMYLRFAPQAKRISYAPSLGRDYIPNYNKRIMCKYINEIPKLSVREDVGQHLIKELTGRDAPVVLDPTFLLSRNDWENVSNKPSETKFMLCYFLSEPTEKTQKQIVKFAKKNDLGIIALHTKLPVVEKESMVMYPLCGPSEFLGYVSEASLVFTDSYHGMIFSTIFQRSFYSIERMSKEFNQSSRQKSLLRILNLENRYVESNNEVLDESIIDYSIVDKKLEFYRRKSLHYLQSALEE